jgi:hypothetical protein
MNATCGSGAPLDLAAVDIPDRRESFVGTLATYDVELHGQRARLRLDERDARALGVYVDEVAQSEPLRLTENEPGDEQAEQKASTPPPNKSRRARNKAAYDSRSSNA